LLSAIIHCFNIIRYINAKVKRVFEKRRKGNGNTAFVVTFFTGVFNRLRDSNSFSLGFFRGESGYFGWIKILRKAAQISRILELVL